MYFLHLSCLFVIQKLKKSKSVSCLVPLGHFSVSAIQMQAAPFLSVFSAGRLVDISKLLLLVMFTSRVVQEVFEVVDVKEQEFASSPR